MPYHIGAKGSNGCSGYPVVSDKGQVAGCHDTEAEATAQLGALYANVADATKSENSMIQTSSNPENPSDMINPEAGMKKPATMPRRRRKKKTENKAVDPSMMMQEVIKEGDFVMGMTSEGMVHGMVEHIMIEGGVYGVPGTEYAIQSMPPENPAMAVRIYEEEDGKWEPTAYSIGMMYKDAEIIDINNHSMEDDEEDYDSEVAMAMYDSSIGKSHSCNSSSSLDKAYEGCGCPTCKELNVNCENCPVCIANSYMSDDEDMDKWNNIEKACWVGYTQQGMKEKDGRMVPNCVPVSKSNDLGKAASVSVGDHVTFAVPKPPDKTESAHGLVERVERSGTVKLPGTNESVEASSDNPVAVIRVYATNESGKRTRTDRRVVKPFSSLRVSSDPIDNEKIYEDDEMEKVSSARLQELADAYNKNKEGDKRITVGALRQVYNRGIGAYRTNPSSVRGSVSSAEQWAMGRVNAFMAGLRGSFPRKPFDLDLFPKGHPRSSKKSLFEDFGKDFSQTERVVKLFKDEVSQENIEKGWGGSIFDLNPFKK